MMNTRTLLSILSIFILGVIAVTAVLTSAPSEPTTPSDQFVVAVSSYPAYEIARMVVGEQARIVQIVPDGIEPHDFEPTPAQVIELFNADMVLGIGLGFDPWVRELESELMAADIPVIVFEDEVSVLESKNPHFWLDPVSVRELIATLGNRIAQNLPERADAIMLQTRDEQTRLLALHNRYEETLATCRLRDVVTPHDVLPYLANRYKLTTHTLSGSGHDHDASLGHVHEVVEVINQKGIRHVFTESGVDAKAVDTLVQETGVETLTFNTMEVKGEEADLRGDMYRSIMLENLFALQTALACQN